MLGVFPALLLVIALPRRAAIAWVIFLLLVMLGDFVLMQRRFTFRRQVDLGVPPARARELVEEAARAVLGAVGTGPQPDDVFYLQAWRPQFGSPHGLEFRIAPVGRGARVTITSFPFGPEALGFSPAGVEVRWRDLESLAQRLEHARS